MKQGTYEEWQERGYQVRKGEKAAGSVTRKGRQVAVFNRSQVDDACEHRKFSEVDR